MKQFHSLPMLIVAVAVVAQARGDDRLPESLRPYDDGRLEASDFHADVPNPRPEENGIPLVALTWTEVRYNFRYRSRFSSRRTTLSLESIEFRAYFDRSKSWNSRKSDRELLDHEQGHFDLAEICALRLQLEFDKRLRSGPGITAVGSSEEQAALDLRREIDRMFQSSLDALLKANQEYDRVTANGTKPGEQERERQKQFDELTRLTEELRASREK